MPSNDARLRNALLRLLLMTNDEDDSSDSSVFDDNNDNESVDAVGDNDVERKRFCRLATVDDDDDLRILFRPAVDRLFDGEKIYSMKMK